MRDVLVCFVVSFLFCIFNNLTGRLKLFRPINTRHGKKSVYIDQYWLIKIKE